MSVPSLADVTIGYRKDMGSWIQIRGEVCGKVVSVELPKATLAGLTDSQIEEKMKRALRAGLPYARE
jgi:hypothetical protein